jgi:hypothetical protein
LILSTACGVYDSPFHFAVVEMMDYELALSCVTILNNSDYYGFKLSVFLSFIISFWLYILYSSKIYQGVPDLPFALFPTSAGYALLPKVKNIEIEKEKEEEEEESEWEEEEEEEEDFHPVLPTTSNVGMKSNSFNQFLLLSDSDVSKSLQSFLIKKLIN